MSSLFAWFRSLNIPADARSASPAAALMSSAGDRAGRDAEQARELRRAASAWLRVVR